MEPMSIIIMSAVWRTKTSSHTEKLVLLALADSANDAGYCWPAIGTIAQKCELTEQGVRNQIRALETKTPQPWLLTVPRTGRSSTYQLAIPPNAVDPSTALTPKPHGGPPPNTVDPTPQHGGGPPPNAVGVEPSVEPSKEPSVEPSRPKKAESRSTIPNSTVIPAALNTPEFRAAWVMWLEHLKQKRKSPSLHAQDLQLRTLSTGGGVEKAIETIQWSIEHNWQGLFAKNSAEKGKPFVNYKNPTGRCT